MLPPGLSFNAVSARALEASRTAKLVRAYWDWRPMLEANAGFYFPYTPATNLLRGLQEALAMLDEEGLPNVFARHDRHGAATRAAVQAWGQAGAVELQCLEPTDYSSSLTAVRLAEGHSADALRALILRRFNMSLGNGLGILKDRVFRIGHLGDINDLTLLGAISGVEMGLKLAGVPIGNGGVDAAMAVLMSAESGRRRESPRPHARSPPPLGRLGSGTMPPPRRALCPWWLEPLMLMDKTLSDAALDRNCRAWPCRAANAISPPKACSNMAAASASGACMQDLPGARTADDGLCCALALERNPPAAQAIKEAGYDICCHGWRWIEHFKLDEATEREHIRHGCREPASEQSGSVR